MPPTLALHDTVAVPDPEIDVGLMAPHMSPDPVLSVNVTIPLNPLVALIAMVELADWPGLIAAGELAEMVKSGDGGPRGRNVSRQPHPMGLLLHCIAP